MKTKPELRHMNQLTKEIAHNGERFVPLIELYKIARGRFCSIVKYHSVMVYNQIQIEMEGHRNFFFGLFISDGDERLGQGVHFQMYSTDLFQEDYREERVEFQNVLFGKLTEWKFDLTKQLDYNLATELKS